MVRGSASEAGDTNERDASNRWRATVVEWTVSLMGPLALSDLVGLDTLMSVAEVMFDEYKEPLYAPPPLLRRMVSAGRLGRKSGRGFYDYGS